MANSTTEPWSKFEQKYEIRAETKQYSMAMVAAGKKSAFDMRDDLEGFRQQLLDGSIQSVEESKAMTGFRGAVEEITIPSASVSGGIPAIVYKPEVTPDVPVIMIYFHGGSLVCCAMKMYEPCMMSLVNHTNAIVVISEYRLLPCADDRLAPFTDAETVTQWILNDKTTVGGVATSPVGVAGDSAGGQICCSMTYSLSKQLDFQILVYPVANIDLNTSSMQEFWDIPAFSGQDMKVMFEWCGLFDEPSLGTDPRVNPSAPRGSDPISNPALLASPPTLVVLAELDSLLDWGLEYAESLKAAGVRTEVHLLKGVPHVCFSLMQLYPTTAAKAHKLVADFIKSLKF